MFEIFSMVSGIDISYKTVERLYLNELVMMALHNMQVLSLKKGIRESDATGDGIVYSMTVKNYESYAQNLRTKPRRTEMMIRASNQQKSERRLLILLGLWTLKLRWHLVKT